jgi:hypothetical protein
MNPQLPVAMMQALYKPSAYPQAIRSQIEAMPQLAVEIANRWMLGWPKTVQALIESGEYLTALKSQEQQERDVLASETTRHLARHEIAELYGLTAAPPSPGALTST